MFFRKYDTIYMEIKIYTIKSDIYEKKIMEIVCRGDGADFRQFRCLHSCGYGG